MSDLISRQAAYTTLTEYYHHTTEIQHKALREALERVPSAQPETHEERTETHTCDYISRQDAIEALNKLKIYRPLDSDRYVISDCLNKIVNLPSAQPEEDCDTCIHGYFGDSQCNNCRVGYPSHYERRIDGQTVSE